MKLYKLLVLFVLCLGLSCPAAQGAKKPKEQQKKTLRVLYWNIQNGMWAGQEDNYERFVAWINEKNPDICIFCEGSSIYATGTADEVPLEERYLPEHWDSLAARYGHSHHLVGVQRKSTSSKYGVDNYPQVVTSKYPLTMVEKFVGHYPDSVIVHGANWIQVEVEGVSQPINIVTLHLKPFNYGYAVPAERRKESAANYEGELHRRKELEYLMNHTIRTQEDGADGYWIMAGDYNSRSRKDNFKYKWSDSALSFYSQDYMASEKSPYYDIVAESYPGIFMPSHGLGERIDYFYVTKALLDACSDVLTERDTYTARMSAGVSNFYTPSDHFPIIVDFKLSKLK